LRKNDWRISSSGDRTIIIVSTSQTELNSPDQRVGISAAALLNRFIHASPTAAKTTATKAVATKAAVSVTIRIIAVGIVPVIWIGIVKERVPKITKEEEPIVEALIV